MPKEVRYFDYFDAHADQIVLGGKALVGLIEAMIERPEQAEQYVQEINQCELRADQIIHETEAMLHTSFITPFDRDEIHGLTNNMDNILDKIEDVAETIGLYDVRRVTPEARKLAQISLTCCEAVAAAVKLLRSMKNGPAILKYCHEIDKLESDGDVALREAMSKLFREEEDVRQMIKLKAVYELLEEVSDCCKDVSNSVESIVLENS